MGKTRREPRYRPLRVAPVWHYQEKCDAVLNASTEMTEAIKSDRSQRQRNRAIWHSLRGDLAKNLEEGHQYELQIKFLAKVGDTDKKDLLKMYGYQCRALTLAALWGMSLTIPEEFLGKYKNDKQNDIKGHLLHPHAEILRRNRVPRG